MKYKLNPEVIILILIFIGSLKILIWTSIDPSTFSNAYQEKIGLSKSE